MDNTKKNVTKKKVTVVCNRPFRIGLIPCTGTMRNVVLSTKEISICLENKCSVVEILENGTTIPLDFSNYNTYNGPTKVTEETPLFYEKSQQKIPIIVNGKIINENVRDTSKKKTIILGTKANIEDKTEVKESVKSDISGKMQAIQKISTTIPTTRKIEEEKKEEPVKSDSKDEKKEFDYNSNNFTNNKKKNKF